MHDVTERLVVEAPRRDDRQFQKDLGSRLRRVRRARGLTLQDVEARSGGRWKAVVVGSYERGDRAVSATKLAQLAAFYDVAISDLMGERDGSVLGGPLGVPPLDTPRVVDAASRDPSVQPLARLLEHVRWLRGDHRAIVLAVRDDDLRALAVTLGIPPEDLPGWLRDRGVLTTQ